jgi:hypothetical protein
MSLPDKFDRNPNGQVRPTVVSSDHSEVQISCESEAKPIPERQSAPSRPFVDHGSNNRLLFRYRLYRSMREPTIWTTSATLVPRSTSLQMDSEWLPAEMTDEPMNCRTHSWPGSRLKKARTADESRTALLILLPPGLGAAIGNEFLGKRYVRRHEFRTELLRLPNCLILRHYSDLIALTTHQEFLSLL